jgi:capsular polysaccharide biosynthesis protein
MYSEEKTMRMFEGELKCLMVIVCTLFVVFGFLLGCAVATILHRPIIANYESQIDIVVKQRDKAKSELATFQAILKQLVEGGWKED